MSHAAATKHDSLVGDADAKPIGIAFAAAFVMVVVLAMGLRFGTNVLNVPATFDEPWITVPIDNLIQQGWSQKTAIDFDETKGPGLIWPYAIAGKLLGGSLNDLRLFSVILFVFGAIPLLDIARRSRLDGVRLMLVAMFYALLPYHSPLAQLVMSEPSFVALSIAGCWLFVVGVEANSKSARIALMALFAVTLSILLHNRVHAVALAAGVTLAAFQRGGIRTALPWAVACLIAGLSRLPLLIHWGGIVSPRFQGLHSLGVNLEGWTYLLATLALPLAILIPIAWTNAYQSVRRWRFVLVVGGAFGAGLSILASPDLSKTVMSAGVQASMYGGIVATTVRTATSSPVLQAVMLGVLATLGALGLAALAAVCHSSDARTPRGAVDRVQAWTLLAGIAISAASAAPQYDRYPLAWIMLMPIIWTVHLPRWAMLVEGIALIAVFGWLSAGWLT